MADLVATGTVPGTILENNQPGDWVASLTLSGAATALEVKLTGSDAARFTATLDAARGVVTITPAGALDREAFSPGADPVLTFGMAVRFAAGWEDSGQQWSVTLAGTDDTPPQSLEFSSGGVVLETDIGAEIGMLLASDPDTDTEALSYSVAWPDDALFEMSGRMLKLRDGVDLLTKGGSDMAVTIEVSDGRQSAAFTVTVSVLNVTDEDDLPAPPPILPPPPPVSPPPPPVSPPPPPPVSPPPPPVSPPPPPPVSPPPPPVSPPPPPPVSPPPPPVLPPPPPPVSPPPPPVSPPPPPPVSPPPPPVSPPPPPPVSPPPPPVLPPPPPPVSPPPPPVSPPPPPPVSPPPPPVSPPPPPPVSPPPPPVSPPPPPPVSPPPPPVSPPPPPPVSPPPPPVLPPPPPPVSPPPPPPPPVSPPPPPVSPPPPPPVSPPPPPVVDDTPIPHPLAIGDSRHGFTQISADVVTSLRMAWDVERIVTGPDHMTQIALASGEMVWVGPVTRIAFANGAIEFSGASDAAEIMRLYQTILGRAPDAEGLVNWVDHLQHGMTLAQAAEGFFGSDEFITRFGGLTHQQLVVNLYREALGRQPDPAGLAHQVAALDAGASRAQIIANFVDSPEAARNFETSHPGGVWVRNTEATVVGMAYDAVFDRAPDATGLPFWTHKLAAGEMSIRQMVEAIASSDEFRARHAGEDDPAYVASIYRSALEREPEPEGLAFWVDHLASHRMDRVDVVMLIGLSDEQKEQFIQHPHGDAFLG